MCPQGHAVINWFNTSSPKQSNTQRAHNGSQLPIQMFVSKHCEHPSCNVSIQMFTKTDRPYTRISVSWNRTNMQGILGVQTERNSFLMQHSTTGSGVICASRVELDEDTIQAIWPRPRNNMSGSVRRRRIDWEPGRKTFDKFAQVETAREEEHETRDTEPSADQFILSSFYKLRVCQ